MEDTDIINYLKSNKHSKQNLAFNFFYANNYKQNLFYKLSSLRIPKTDYDDIYQNCLILLFEQVRKKDFVLKNKLANYFSSMIKYEWFRLKKKRKKLSEFNQEIEFESFVEPISKEDLMLEINKEKALSNLLLKIDENCRKVLHLFYYQKMSMKEIAIIFKYSTEQVAKNKKMRCLKKLQKYIDDHKLKSSFL